MSEIFGIDPLMVKRTVTIDYIHSYGEYSQYFVGLSKGRILATHCAQCQKTWLPPRVNCPCGNNDTTWVDAPLQGRVHTFSVARFGPEEFAHEMPYVLAYIEFDGVDTLLLAKLEDVEPEKVKIGMKVRARFKRLPNFKANDVSFVPVA